MVQIAGVHPFVASLHSCLAEDNLSLREPVLLYGPTPKIVQSPQWPRLSKAPTLPPSYPPHLPTLHSSTQPSPLPPRFQLLPEFQPATVL